MVTCGSVRAGVGVRESVRRSPAGGVKSCRSNPKPSRRILCRLPFGRNKSLPARSALFLEGFPLTCFRRNSLSTYCSLKGFASPCLCLFAYLPCCVLTRELVYLFLLPRASPCLGWRRLALACLVFVMKGLRLLVCCFIFARNDPF